MEQIERYNFHSVTDFHRRRSAQTMFFELEPETQLILARSYIQNDIEKIERIEFRRLLMQRLSSHDGDQLYERIRLAFMQEKARDSKSGRA